MQCEKSGKSTVYHGTPEPMRYEALCTCGAQITVEDGIIPAHDELA